MNNIQSISNQLQQSQNCIQQPWYHQQSILGWQQPEVRYVTVPADCSIDRVENGYIVTIAGKRYVALDAIAIRDLIDEKLKTK